MGNRRNIYSKYRILKISSSYGIWRATGIFLCVNKIKKRRSVNTYYTLSLGTLITVIQTIMWTLLFGCILLYRDSKTEEKHYHGKKRQQWSLT